MKYFYEPPEIITPDMEAELIFVAPEGMPFWKKILIYVSVWLGLILAFCGFLLSVLVQYEHSLPTTAMDSYIVSSRQDMFFFATSNTLSEIDNRFESAYDIASSLAKEHTGKLSYSKLSTEYTHEKPVYLIKHDGENLFKVTLGEGEETGFMHFKGYAVEKVELVKEGLFTLKNYNVVFAKNMLIHINNTALGTKLAEFDKFEVFGRDDYYGIVVKNFTYEPKIIALSYEFESAPDKVVSAKRVGNFYIFEDKPDAFHTLTVTAPADAVVKIDGKTVSDIFITKRYSEIFEGSDVPTDFAVYTIPTVYSAMDVSVTLGGTALNVERNGMAFTAMLGSATCTVTVPKGADLYLGNKKIDDSLITNKNAMWHSDFDEIRKYPTAVEYTLTGIVSSSAISAKLGDKELVAYRDGSNIVFTDAKSEELKTEFSAQAEEFVNQYLYYSTQGYRNTATNLRNTLKLVAPSCPLRTYLNLANVGIEYKSPQTMKLEYLTADNFVPFGDNAFVCDVSYKAILNDTITEVIEENVIHLIFIKSDGEFLPAKFIL